MACFSFLATMSRAAVNIHVQVFVWTLVVLSLGHVPRSGIVGSSGHHLVFCGAARLLLFRVTASLYLPTSLVQGGGEQRLWQELARAGVGGRREFFRWGSECMRVPARMTQERVSMVMLEGGH